MKNRKYKGIYALSPLEEDVLEILWGYDGTVARTRDIYHKLKKKRKVALTSVAVILDRLYKKKLVSRKIRHGRGGVHYIYSPRMSKNDFHKFVVGKTVDRLINNFGSIAVSYFNERFREGSRRKR